MIQAPAVAHAGVTGGAIPARPRSGCAWWDAGHRRARTREAVWARFGVAACSVGWYAGDLLLQAREAAMELLHYDEATGDYTLKMSAA